MSLSGCDQNISIIVGFIWASFQQGSWSIVPGRLNIMLQWMVSSRHYCILQVEVLWLEQKVFVYITSPKWNEGFVLWQFQCEKILSHLPYSATFFPMLGLSLLWVTVTSLEFFFSIMILLLHYFLRFLLPRAPDFLPLFPTWVCHRWYFSAIQKITGGLIFATHAAEWPTFACSEVHNQCVLEFGMAVVSVLHTHFQVDIGSSPSEMNRKRITHWTCQWWR